MPKAIRVALPRLRELCQAAVGAGGSRRRIRKLLQVSDEILVQRFSFLHHLGVARTMTLFDHRVLCGSCRSTTWIRMARMGPAEIERFEEALRQDPTVMSAQRVAGDCDYRLSCLHQGHHQAAEWAHALRCRPEVAEVRQVVLRHLFGHELPGVVI